MTLHPEIQRWATVSDDEQYRYDLGREWSDGDRMVTWVLLNPSVADAERDDMTVTKCIEFSRRAGFDALCIVNLFGYRTTDPAVLLDVEDPVGPENFGYLKRRIADSDLVVCGWGSTIETVQPKGVWVKSLSRYNVEGYAAKCGVPVKCLGTTQGGHPRHPSRVGYKQPLVLFGDQRDTHG